ncbi:MAG: hypothetical protein UW99_C0021G0013 [Candidatus Collierbacteria bacterium GW2011_GWC2_45_15]|uniref:Uncharacterized protein n=2 Tax=Candidatus Collieribacteriota TaxID=1752725 RepID=A0A0G1GJZ9_9BACT|nr:MAG: hypothetical protein UW23_C0031G0002 [Candidatus Collierbacteria bacterium GW2011_GWA1_44_12]KKT98676.1 MAG: hypothetical protein UW99_C0021G0013 [Candidatus Collierbacteria bacterium GW2011_GWC2_45_15]
MSDFGLLLIIIAWGIQFFAKGKNINPLFIATYVAGVALLTFDGFANDQTSPAFYNFVALVIALAVFFKHKK